VSHYLDKGLSPALIQPRFRVETADDSLQPTIDMLLNISVFMWYGAIAPWASFRVNDVVPISRLIPLGILILLFRRIPMVFLIHKQIPEIEEFRQAAFVGFFGPIGVSAIFYLYVSVDFLRQITVDGVVREDAAHLEDVMRVVIWFLAICSIVVHGLSVPLGKLGYHLPRTMSQALSSTSQENDQPPSFHLTRRFPHVAAHHVRRRRKLDRQPEEATLRIGQRTSGMGHIGQDNLPEPSRPVHFVDTPPARSQSPVDEIAVDKAWASEQIAKPDVPKAVERDPGPPWQNREIVEGDPRAQQPNEEQHLRKTV